MVFGSDLICLERGKIDKNPFKRVQEGPKMHLLTPKSPRLFYLLAFSIWARKVYKVLQGAKPRVRFGKLRS